MKEKKITTFGIRSKFVLVCSGLVTCVIIACLVIFQSFYEVLRLNASQSIVSEISQIQMNIEMFLSEINQQASSVFHSNETRRLLSGASNEEEVNALLQKAREDIREEMDVNVNLSMLSSQMRIISSSYKELVGKQRVLGTHWIDKINRAEGGKVIISSYTVADAFLESNSKIISIARLLHSTDQQNKGIMIVDIPVQYIRHLCETVNLGRNGFIAVLDDDDVVLYHSNEQQVGTTFRQKILTNTGEKPYSLVSIDNSEMLVSQIRANYSGYVVLGAVATSAIYRQIGQLQSAFLVAMLVLLMLSIAAIWVVTHNLTKPIVRMSHMMRRIEQGDFSPCGFELRRDELGYLERNFDTMLRKLNELIDQEYKAAVHAREVEYKVLAASIEPHFIYNTLVMISMTAYMHDDLKTFDMLNLLADLFRFSASTGKKLVTLSYECRHAEIYLEICRMRNPDQFETEWDVPEILDNCMVLPMLLQPIVENVVKYAFANMENGGILHICGRKISSDTIKLTVVDNGEGISQERMLEISSILCGNRENAGMLALKNIHDRIRLNFGSQYGLSISNNLKSGITVSVLLPVLGGETDVTGFGN